MIIVVALPSGIACSSRRHEWLLPWSFEPCWVDPWHSMGITTIIDLQYSSRQWWLAEMQTYSMFLWNGPFVQPKFHKNCDPMDAWMQKVFCFRALLPSPGAPTWLRRSHPLGLFPKCVQPKTDGFRVSFFPCVSFFCFRKMIKTADFAKVSSIHMGIVAKKNGEGVHFFATVWRFQAF